MSDRNITEYDIQALVDDELEDGERAYIIAQIRENPLLLKRYNELKRQKELLKNWWSSGEGYQS